MNADIGRATKEEVTTYYELLDGMMAELKAMPKRQPDLLIHIHVSYETMIKRIQKRGRISHGMINIIILLKWL
ncbi:Deoxyguanosine kinase [Chlamydia trachomatis]|nr:Deoxyguanosine kinase [Chlamydia trachomatis]